MTRGSRKHILDWTTRANFLSQFEDLVGLPGCVIRHSAIFQPRGHEDSKEACIEDSGANFIPGFDCWDDLASWWLRHRRGANKPNWDLVVACNISGMAGLALVEAKAHERELDWAGKRLSSNASKNSAENHVRIGEAIAEASAALDRIVPDVHISRDSHYQLSNRVAYCWKIASMGIPVLLIYLGFIGDNGISNVGPPFRDSEHWQSVMQTYTHGVMPMEFLDRWIPCGKAQMRMLIRSMPVLEQSPTTANG